MPLFKKSLVVIASIFSINATVQAEPFIYPTKGQSAEQLENDKYQCYTWGKNQTGFDPMNPPVVSTAPAGRAPVAGGAARGAAGGAVIGAIAGDAGKGAAIGAATGGGVRAARNRGASNQQAAQAQQQSGDIAQMRSQYDRAYGVCLEGRGYNVK